MKFFIILFGGLFIACGKSDNITTASNNCSVIQYANAPNQSWFSSNNGSEEEAHGHFILTCTDEGFLQVGETGFIPNSAKILIVKTDKKGTLLWKKEFSIGGHNLGNTAIETNDVYLICGSLDQNSTLLKLNKTDGSVIFKKTYDLGGSDAFEHLAITKDGVIAVGYINADDNLNTFFTEGEGYVTFLSSDGTLLNGININMHLSLAYRIKLHNNEFIISGLTDKATNYGLIKMNGSGEVI